MIKTNKKKNSILSLENVSISYGTFEAVRNVFCNFKKGKITSLIVDHGLRKNSGKECKETQNILKKRKIFSHCFKWKFY